MNAHALNLEIGPELAHWLDEITRRADCILIAAGAYLVVRGFWALLKEMNRP